MLNSIRSRFNFFGASPSSAQELEGFEDEIRTIGFHPFILVRIDNDPRSQRFIHCRTQNEAREFVERIVTVPNFSDSLLVRGIVLALRQEIDDASELLYRWTRYDGMTGEAVQICKPDGKHIEHLFNYPVFAFDCAHATVRIGKERTRALLDMLEAYAIAEGNDALRVSIMEAVALALGRAMDTDGNYERVLAAVEKGLAVEPDSDHLKTAERTLLRRSKGKSASPQKFAGAPSPGAPPNPAVDIELIERFSQHWQANASSYQQMLGDLRNAARRLLPMLLYPKINGLMLTNSERESLRSLEKEVACLARQPLFFPEMFHGVTLLADGSFRQLDSWNTIHFRANGLLGTEDQVAIRQIYERLSQDSVAALRVVEIGSAVGRGSTQIAGGFVKRSGGILYCVDPWVSPDCADPLLDPLHHAFLGNIQIFGLENTIIPIRSPSANAAALFEDHSLDAVFVDGNHEYPYVLADIDAYLPKIRKGGIMFGHDLHDLPSRFDRSELLSISKLNKGMVNYKNAKGEVERVNVHPGVILAVQDRFGDDVEHFAGSVVWAKQI